MSGCARQRRAHLQLARRAAQRLQPLVHERVLLRERLNGHRVHGHRAVIVLRAAALAALLVRALLTGLDGVGGEQDGPLARVHGDPRRAEQDGLVRAGLLGGRARPAALLSAAVRERRQSAQRAAHGHRARLLRRELGDGRRGLDEYACSPLLQHRALRDRRRRRALLLGRCAGRLRIGVTQQFEPSAPLRGGLRRAELARRGLERLLERERHLVPVAQVDLRLVHLLVQRLALVLHRAQSGGQLLRALGEARELVEAAAAIVAGGARVRHCRA